MEMEDGKIKYRLADIMKRKGVSAAYLAKMTGIPRKGIMDANRGEYEFTQDERLRIADALHIDIDELYCQDLSSQEIDDSACEIKVPRGAVGAIARDFGVTEKTVFNALRALNDSPTTRKIRKYAMEHFYCDTSRKKVDNVYNTVYVAYLVNGDSRKVVAVCTLKEYAADIAAKIISTADMTKCRLLIEKVKLNTLIED